MHKTQDEATKVTRVADKYLARDATVALTCASCIVDLTQQI